MVSAVHVLLKYIWKSESATWQSKNAECSVTGTLIRSARTILLAAQQTIFGRNPTIIQKTDGKALAFIGSRIEDVFKPNILADLR